MEPIEESIAFWKGQAYSLADRVVRLEEQVKKLEYENANLKITRELMQKIVEEYGAAS